MAKDERQSNPPARPLCAAGMGVLRAFFFTLALLLPVMISGCSAGTGNHSSATEGKLRVGVDASLAGAAAEQGSIFTAHYPDASIDVVPQVSGKTLLALLKHENGAAMINGPLTAAEDSLLLHPERRGRKEPVARDAVICIVNRKSPVDSIDLETLGAMFSGQKASSLKLVPWTSRHDFRLLATLRTMLETGDRKMHAMQCGSDSLLVLRVASDHTAAGLLYLSAYNTLSLNKPVRDQIRILPVASGKPGLQALLPSEQYLFDGKYPLGTIVYYIYLPQNPLAAGFGSWLSKEGQKTFERNYLAPVRQLPRTIILK